MQQQNKAEGFDIHIGKLIQEELKRQGRKNSWLADELHYERTNVGKICQRESIDTALLLRISIILGVDFFEPYSRIAKREISSR